MYVCREATRELYAPFESNMRYSSTDVYQHEMPGGQYTNLKFQAASLGLGDSWNKVQSSYAAANRYGDRCYLAPKAASLLHVLQQCANFISRFKCIPRSKYCLRHASGC